MESKGVYTGHYTLTLPSWDAQYPTYNSVFALPGYQLPPRLCDADLYIYVVVDDSLDVWCAAGGSGSQTFWNEDVVNESYPSRLYVAPTQWTWTYDDDAYPVAPSNGRLLRSETITVSSGVYSWTIPQIDVTDYAEGSEITETQLASDGFVDMGSINQFGYDPSTGTSDGVVWVSGLGWYQVTDAQYPTVISVPIPGISTYLDYYPGARYETTWLSTNRGAGFCKRLKSGAWADVTNSGSGDASTSNGFTRSATSWDVAAKMGDES